MAEFNFHVTPPSDFSPLVDDISKHTIVHQFEKIVKKYPDKTAIKAESQSLTYAEFDNAINDLAFEILELTNSDKSPVAYLHQNELLGIVTLFGTLKAGKIYVGLHPSNSPEQILSYLHDAGSKLLITSSEYSDLTGQLIQAIPDLKVHFFDSLNTNFIHPAPPYHTPPDTPMGISYTSGTTGEPKGVIFSQLSRIHPLQYQINGWKFSPSDRIALVTSAAYLASHPSLFGALLTGATLCLFDIKNNSAQKALDWIINEKLTVFRSTPSIFRSIFGLVPKDWVFPDLRFLTLGGEPIPATDIELFKQHTRPDCVLMNNYACSEVGNTCHNPVTHDHPLFEGYLPAGFPAPGKEVFITDQEGHTVPDGEFGEVTVRSKYMSTGYWNNEALTNERYAVDPIDPEFRICYTGDLGRILPNGKFEVKGRKDTQVKLRGFRVQLEALDIELKKLPGVLDAAAKIHLHEIAGERLAAFIVTKDDEPIPVTQYREQLKKHLPNFMIPSVFVQLDSLPRTPTGKISRKELPEPLQQRPDITSPYIEPNPGEEARIAGIWANLLGIDQIGADDNFFELGGDSLLALQMTLSVEEQLSKSFPQTFFKHPTIRHLVTQWSTESENTSDVFKLSSTEEPAAQQSPKSRVPLLETLRAHKFSRRDFEYFYRKIDLMIGKMIAERNYEEAKKWMIEWSRRKLIRSLFYGHRRRLYGQWYSEATEGKKLTEENFQRALLTSLYSRLPQTKYKKGQIPTEEYQNSRYPFFRSLSDLLENSPLDKLVEVFPLKGLEQLSEAFQRGKGVILISYHGPPRIGGFTPLTRVLGINQIPTISVLVPIRQSAYQNPSEIDDAKVSAKMNSELAHFGQKQLRQGKIISYFSDVNDRTGITYQVILGGRLYQMKAGVAEMAINTGAAVIPFTRYCLPDARIQMEFFPEIKLHGTTRKTQTENLMQEYADFINMCWQTHPEAIQWARIWSHFNRPIAKEQ